VTTAPEGQEDILAYHDRGGNRGMVETGGEGLERLKELSDRQAAHARELLDVIEKRRDEAREQGMNFATLDADRLLDKLRGGNTPFLSWWAFNYRTPAPGTLTIWVGVDNPDPIDQWFLYLHFFVGPAALSGDLDHALAMVDARFPRAIEPEYAGLLMSPFEQTQLNFFLPISGQVEETHYLGNLLLIQLLLGETPGRVLDRESLVFKVRDAPAPP
jgi:hypothetical protein